MMDRKQIGARLKEARVAKRLSQAAVAKALGFSQASLSEWEKGEHLPSMPKILELAEWLGMEGTGDIEDALTPDRTGLSDLVPDMVAVPVFDVRASAGSGSLATEMDPVAYWPFPRLFFDTMGRHPKAFLMISVWGDSMEPTLRSGARIVVDTQRTNPAQPGIYVLDVEGMEVVKRLDMIPGSRPPRLRISSDNPLHQAYEAPASDVRVIGGVCAVISTM